MCDFEASLCGWNQTTADDFDWTIRTGQTSTVNTGPSTDHTLGTSSGNDAEIFYCSFLFA